MGTRSLIDLKKKKKKKSTIASETAADPTMHKLLEVVSNEFPDECRTEDSRIASFWIYRDSLYVSDGVLLYNDRVVIPPALRSKVLEILHAAHQGISAMESRARAIVFWPGLTDDMKKKNNGETMFFCSLTTF